MELLYCMQYHYCTLMSSSVTQPTHTIHQGSMTISEGKSGRRSRTFFLRKSLRLDRHWFIRSMYWLRPIPNRRKPGLKEPINKYCMAYHVSSTLASPKKSIKKMARLSKCYILYITYISQCLSTQTDCTHTSRSLQGYNTPHFTHSQQQ